MGTFLKSVNQALRLSFIPMTLVLSACQTVPSPVIQPSPALSPSPSPTQLAAPTETATAQPSSTPTLLHPTLTPSQSAAPTASATPPPLVPDFSHIIIIVLEDQEFGSVIGNPAMPSFNKWASEYALLTQHFAITHPSLPNYLALIGGDTFGVNRNCEQCFQDAPTLADLIEASGRTWKSYQEDMPTPCFAGSTLSYVQKHNPFMYFDAIRLDRERCERSVVPLEQLDRDLSAQDLPDFAFITPNLCNSAHDCGLNIADIWLGRQVSYLLAYPAIALNGLIIITWDEGSGDRGCCGFDPGGGRIATVLISPLVKPGFQDDTPYTLYSLLKTIAAAWGLSELGHAADPETALITAPWKR